MHTRGAWRLGLLATIMFAGAKLAAEPAPPADRDAQLAEAERLNDRASEVYGAGQRDQAVTLAERALAIYQALLAPDDVKVGVGLHNLAVIHAAMGNIDKAEPLFRRVLTIWVQKFGAEHPAVAAVSTRLGMVALDRGDLAAAAAAFGRALVIWEKAYGPEHPDVASALNNLAYVHKVAGEHEEAEPLYLRAVAIEEKLLGPEDTQLATTLTNLAELYREMADYVRAEPLYRRALAMREKLLGPEHTDVATSLNNLALLHQDKGDFTGAEPLFQRALAIEEKLLGPEHPELAVTLNNLGTLYLDLKQPAKAAALLRRALDIIIRARGAEHPEVAAFSNNLGHLYLGRGEVARAEALFRRALAIWRHTLGPRHRNVAQSYDSLGHVSIEKHDYAGAEKLFARSLAISEAALGGFHPDVLRTIRNFADVAWIQGHLSDALKRQTRARAIEEHNLALLLAVGSERQKQGVFEQLSGATSSVVSLALAMKSAPATRLALTTVLRRKGRVLDALSDEMAALRRRMEPTTRRDLDRLARARAALATLILGTGARVSGDDARAQIDAITREVDQLETSLAARSAAFRMAATPVELDRVQAALPEGAALVEYFLYQPREPRSGYGKHRYAAFVVTRGGEPRMVDLGEHAIIDDALLRYRESLADPSRRDFRELSRRLDGLVMAPVRRLLGGRRWLFLSPDGGLALVPFAALVDDGGHYLIERYALSYLTSGRDLLRGGTDRARAPALIIGAPDYGEHAGAVPVSPAGPVPGRRSINLGKVVFPPLPGTADEATDLLRLMPGAELVVGAAATEDAVKRLHGPRLLHIATHGFFLLGAGSRAGADQRGLDLVDDGVPASRANPLLESGLAMAGANRRVQVGEDGILTALEVAGLDLDGTRLVVLSACETGLGEAVSSDGVLGLRRALVLAGAETQVMSLWKVPDAETRHLMVDYYGRLVRGGGRAEAMREVQLLMLAAPATKHPYYWASFIVSGDSTALDGRRVIPAGVRGPRGCGCVVGGRGAAAGTSWLALVIAISVVVARLCRGYTARHHGRALQRQGSGREVAEAVGRGERVRRRRA